MINIDNDSEVLNVDISSGTEICGVFTDEKLDVLVSESSMVKIPVAVNYIKSGEAEIAAAVTRGTNTFNANAQQKTTEFNNKATSKTTDFNANVSDKTTAFNNNATSKTTDFNDNATDKTNAFNSNASDKTTDFNDNYTAKKALIDAEVSTASGYASEAKQWAIGNPSEPSGGSAKYWANQASTTLSSLDTRVDNIEDVIPSAASSSNQLADKSYVNTADNNLQTQIDAITAASDVTDIVGTYAQLQAYDTTSLPNNSIIKVLKDESRDDETTYYRWVITGGVGAWVLIGEEGPYLTLAAASTEFATKQDTLVSGTNIKTVNNQSLLGSGNITITGGGAVDSVNGYTGVVVLTAGDVGVEAYTANEVQTIWESV